MEGTKIQRKWSLMTTCRGFWVCCLRLNLIRLPMLVSDLQNGHFIQLSLIFLMHTHTYSGVCPNIEHLLRTQILVPDLSFFNQF